MVTLRDGVRLCVETFGSSTDPTVLLLGGATSSMDWWEPAFCARLVAAGRHVVRFDARDTGASTQWPAGEPGYTGEDLSLDPLRVLDALGVGAAHLVGVSMGGGIAQDLAVRFPERVRSLTLVATSCAFERTHPTPLPPPEPRIRATFEEPQPEIDWADEEAVVEEMLRVQRLYAGPVGFEEDRVRSIARLVVRRTPDVRAATTNHWLVVGGGEGSTATMADVRAATLVVHGTADPMFPLPHGQALAAAITGARLLPIEGMGHQVPPEATWDVVVPAIVALTGQRSPRSTR